MIHKQKICEITSREVNSYGFEVKIIFSQKLLGIFEFLFCICTCTITCKPDCIRAYSQKSYLKLACPNKKSFDFAGFYSNYTYTFRTKAETRKWDTSDRNLCFLLVHLLPKSAFYVTSFYIIIILLLFSLKKEKSIIYSKRRSFCFVCTVYLSLVQCGFYHFL